MPDTSKTLNATRTVAIALGLMAAITGMISGCFEILQGNLPAEFWSEGANYATLSLFLGPVIWQGFALFQRKFVYSDEFEQMEYASASFRVGGEIVTELPRVLFSGDLFEEISCS